MILVTLGTHELPFNRLVDALDSMLDAHLPNSLPVVLQRGHSKPSRHTIKQFSFLEADRFAELMTEANYVITHAGVGSVMSSLRNNKSVIACPRYHELSEHVDDHQVEWCNAIESKGWVLTLKAGDDLSVVFEKLKSFKSSYKPEPHLIHHLIEKFDL